MKNYSYLDLRNLRTVEEYRNRLFSFYAIKIYRASSEGEKVSLANKLIEQSRSLIKPVDNFRVIEEDERIADIRSVAVRMEVC